jgi:hypothetical protein
MQRSAANRCFVYFQCSRRDIKQAVPDELAEFAFKMIAARGGMMQETEKKLTHANCGGNIRLEPTSQHYVCDRCRAEAEGMISSSEGGEGEAEEVLLCNPHEDTF